MHRNRAAKSYYVICDRLKIITKNSNHIMHHQYCSNTQEYTRRIN